MSITLNGTTGITTPDLTSVADIEANGSAVLTSVSSLASANLTGSVPSSAMPAGSVLQVVQYTTDGGATYAANDYVEMLNGAITPSSVSNKILIMYQVGTGESGRQPMSARLRRDTTVVGSNTATGGTSRMGNMASAANGAFSLQHQMQVMVGHILDSPSTTSAITYRLDVSPRNDDGTKTWRLGQVWSEQSSGYSMPVKTTLTLMEIAG